ncbi:hypothetical protein Pint_00391 [Pistacia integerrima]|uniref:Uncharacterized protein n=1 Tax=Pistacia integerrima TaxID=434235 RepID=A0ACC0ZMK3_9ROSI|nr:hypothetical protein Pint_00391 [Pistacia integerrima]
MLVLKPYDSSLLKSAVAAVAKIIDTNAAICYNEDGVSLYVYGKFRGLIIATLHLLPTGFEIFDCGKPGHIYIDLTAFCEKLNMATDQEAIEISFGDIRRIKIPKGDRMIIFRFKDMGTDKIRCHQMEFRKFKEVPEFAERYDDMAIGVPSQEFNRVFEELAIPGEAAGADDNDLLNISVNNEQLRFLRKNKEIILMKELGKYEIRGATIDEPIELECSIDWGRSRPCLKAAVNMTDEVLMFRSKTLGAMNYSLKCQIGKLGYLIFHII